MDPHLYFTIFTFYFVPILSAPQESVAPLWPNGNIPYEVDSSINTDQENLINSILNDFNDLIPGLKFSIRNNEENYISFEKKNFCGSKVGMKGGKQKVFLSSQCLSKKGVIMHQVCMPWVSLMNIREQTEMNI